MIKFTNEDNLVKQNQYLMQQLEDQKQQVSGLLTTLNDIIYLIKNFDLDQLHKKKII
jgi:hypothetical protein